MRALFVLYLVVIAAGLAACFLVAVLQQ